MRTALAEVSAVLLAALACAPKARRPELPLRPCVVDGNPARVAPWDGGPLPPGWRVVDVSFEHEVACFSLDADERVRTWLNDAGRQATEWSLSHAAWAVDHPAVGSRVSLAIDARRHWYYSVEWENGNCYATNGFDTGEPDGGPLRLVPESREKGCLP